MIPLNEIYFGKVISLQQMEQTLDQLRNKYSSHWREDIPRLYRVINRDPLVQERLPKYVKDQFGFGEVIVTITNSTELNASTLGIMADKNGIGYLDDMKPIQLKDAIITTSEGIRYDNKKIKPSILILISMGILFSERITTAELMAALLHEIGHSFSKACMASDKFNQRIDERFADSFATMYGYGPELNSVLTKISVTKQYDGIEKLRHIPIVNIFVGLNNIRSSIMDRGFRGLDHPSIHKRMSNTIAQLEYDLNRADNLTPKKKMELQILIDRAKSDMNKFYDESPYMSDSVYRFYMRNIEPRLPKESEADEYMDTYGSYSIIDKRVNSMRRR